MKKVLLIFSFLLIGFSFGCKSLLPDDPFISMKNEDVLAECVTLQKKGGYDGKSYDLKLVFTEEQKQKIKAVEWSLVNSLNDVVASRIDTVALSEKEEERVWPADHQFSLSTGLLPIENYRLLVTVYDDFLKEDEKILFRTAKFKRTFTFEFIISEPPALTGLFVKKLGEGQDTGYSKTDLVTKFNKNLIVYGETILDPAITSDPNTKVYFAMTKLPGNSERKRSPDLSYTGEGGVVNSLLWDWKCTETLSDGQWSVVLHLDTVNKEGQHVSVVSQSSFIITIDTVAPEVCWSFKLDSGNLVKNQTCSVSLPITEMPSFAFGFPADLQGQPLEDEKLRFRRWATFAFVDSSPAYPSGLDGTTSVYVGTNFEALQEGDYKGFDPFVAGIQEIEVSAWDAAGNKSPNQLKRRVLIQDPTLKRNFVNGDFSAKSGVSSFSDIGSLENAQYVGWKSKIYWLEYWDKPYEKVSEKNAPQIETAGWNQYFNCFVKNHEGNQCLNFVEFNQNTGVFNGNRWMLSTGGKVYQEFVLYKGVSYEFSGRSANGDLNNPVEPSALFVEHVHSKTAPDFVGNGKTGNFPFMIGSDSIKEGDHIYYLPFTLRNGAMETKTLTFVAPSSGAYNMGFAKKGYNASGNYGSGWTLCDDASLNITAWPKVNATPLMP